MSSAPLLPKNNTYHKRTSNELKHRTTPSPPPTSTSLTNIQQQQHQNSNKKHTNHIIFSEHKKLLDLCLQNNAFKDCQILSEKIIHKFNQKYIPLSTDEAKFQKKLYAYAIYSLAKSFYLRGLTNQARLVFEQYDFSDSFLYPEYTLQFAQCYYDLSKFCKVQQVLVGKNSNDSSFLISELKSRFDDENHLPFALRLLALSHLKRSNTQLAKELLSEALTLFPFLWTTIEAYFSTFSREELANNKLPELSDFFDNNAHNFHINHTNGSHEVHRNDGFEYNNNDENRSATINLENDENREPKYHIPISEIQVKSTSSTSLTSQPTENIDSDTSMQNNNVSPNSRKCGRSKSPKNQKSPQTVSQLLQSLYKEYCLYFHCLSNTLLLFKKLDYEECIRSSYATSIALTSTSYKFRGLSAYNLQRYDQSIDILLQYRSDYSYLTEGCDYLSSALWHLKKRKQLAVLSRELKETNQYSVEAWVSLGNLLSLEKHQGQSIQAFQRSVELAIPPGLYPDLNVNSIVSRWTGGFDVAESQKLSYCLCLLGHEMLDYNDLDGALKCYSHAILADKYLYQAYYGIGTIYMQKVSQLKKTIVAS